VWEGDRLLRDAPRARPLVAAFVALAAALAGLALLLGHVAGRPGSPLLPQVLGLDELDPEIFFRLDDSLRSQAVCTRVAVARRRGGDVRGDRRAARVRAAITVAQAGS
jgi:hypothetical protein